MDKIEDFLHPGCLPPPLRLKRKESVSSALTRGRGGGDHCISYISPMDRSFNSITFAASTSQCLIATDRGCYRYDSTEPCGRRDILSYILIPGQTERICSKANQMFSLWSGQGIILNKVLGHIGIQGRERTW